MTFDKTWRTEEGEEEEEEGGGGRVRGERAAAAAGAGGWAGCHNKLRGERNETRTFHLRLRRRARRRDQSTAAAVGGALRLARGFRKRMNL